MEFIVKIWNVPHIILMWDKHSTYNTYSSGRLILNLPVPSVSEFNMFLTDYGCTSDGITTYINASTCTLEYKPTHPPVVFDFPLPPGHTKDEVIGSIQKASQKN